MPLTEADPPRVGPYRLVGRIGRGGQATVYLGIDTTGGGTDAAVKVLHADLAHEPRQKDGLRRELANASKVAAGVTAKILKFELDGRLPYIASEDIEGSTLSETVRDKGALTGGVLSSVAMQTMLSLEAIHVAGVVHCDFKPDNVILSPHGPRVIDFGIAMALESTHRIGEIAGTYHYMAPEQIANARLTAAVDLFAYESVPVMTSSGRPQADWTENIESIDGSARWSQDDGRTGTVIFYTLTDRHQAAIWWESDTDPVACAAFGARGSQQDLLDGFLRRGFHLE
ncbi:serine/threonine-protein kinase [Paractinoplanes maris]|uniref:serine/threonine-protein kinase n=1 Tax=Paractinoplanes maris TaxID=1734446 RepID=UPI00201FC629|nr:serine/threonine-protein kinase [Actinoplanes maris]